VSQCIRSDPEAVENLDYDSDQASSAGPDAAPAVTTADVVTTVTAVTTMDAVTPTDAVTPVRAVTKPHG
jgi:hypothetical protein